MTLTMEIVSTRPPLPMDDPDVYELGTIKCDGCFRYYPESNFEHDCRNGRVREMPNCACCVFTMLTEKEIVHVHTVPSL